MNRRYALLLTVVSLTLNYARADAPTDNTPLNEYAAQGPTRPDAETDKRLWFRTFQGKGRFPERRCSSCHTDQLQQPGKHVGTNRTIAPLAPSVNPKRLSNIRQLRMWLKHHCKWPLGCDCTP